MARIRELDPIVASRIAAGEVVERPASVLRELLDNAIDAKSTKISVYLEQGGIRSLTVIDNGCGMSKEDLVLACKSHATSKVSSLEDLFNIKTLGFRGEALSSIASCSLLTISSNNYKIVVDNGNQSQVMPSGVSNGTSVSMEFLFENIPARKLFLKRPQSESAECRKIFIEKALGFEEIEFLLFIDGVLTLHFERSNKKERSCKVMSLDKNFLEKNTIDMSYEAENLKLFAISSDPSCYKRDRSQIKVFVNNRVVDNYQLVQAITSSYSAALPGGAFPYFHLFIENNPSLVDFNIHPAKRECKLRNQSQIYGSITNMVRDALISNSSKKTSVDEKSKDEILLNYEAKEEKTEKPSVTYTVNKDYSLVKDAVKTQKSFDSSWFENAKAIMAKKENLPVKNIVEDKEDYNYIGQVFDTFLLVQTKDEILLIDQHALHERLLYDELLSLKDVQHLIVAYQFEVERSVDDFLKENSILYSDFGIELTKVDDLFWEINSLPAAARKNEKDIVSYIQKNTGDIQSIQKGLFAIIACHSAIKANDKLDDITAKALVKKAFSLDRMTCPHGRPFTHRITKDELYKSVGRIV